MTVRDLGTRVLQDLNIVAAGETPSPEDMQLFLDTLNDWVDALKTERLSAFAVTRSTWTITAASSYTVGSGGTINIDRPVNPQAISAIGYQNTALTPVQEVLFGRPLTIEQYAQIPNKALTALYPSAFYYNPTFGASGLGALTPWPIPTASNLQGVIYAPSAVAEFADLDVVIALPPGYRRFMRSNLAIECASPFHAQPSQETRMIASDSMAQVKRANERLVDLNLSAVAGLFGGGGASNIYTGP